MKKEYIGISGIPRKLFLIVLFILFLGLGLSENEDFGNFSFISIVPLIFVAISLIIELFIFDIYTVENKLFYTNYIVKKEIKRDDFIKIKNVYFFPYLYVINLINKKILFTSADFKPFVFSFFKYSNDFSKQYEGKIKDVFLRSLRVSREQSQSVVGDSEGKGSSKEM